MRKIECFKEMIDTCFLHDAHYQGQKFTWFRVREGELIKERLDKVLVGMDGIILEYASDKSGCNGI